MRTTDVLLRRPGLEDRTGLKQHRINWAVAAGAIVLNLALVMAGVVRAQERRSGATAGTWAFEMPAHPGGMEPWLDLRSLNEQEAGESGFIQRTRDGSGFALGDGTPVRFWAVGSELYNHPTDEIARHVRFLARIGVNMVRLHTQIAPSARGARIDEVDAKEIDGIWRFVAEAKKAGIYTTISPYWANGKEVDGWGIEGYSGKTDLWAVLFFNETLQRGYKAWARALYARKNPYTGIPLAEDPAVALIQVQNEDSLMFWTTQLLRPPQQERLGRKFGAWLARKYGSLDRAKQAWEGAGQKDDDFAGGRVGFLGFWPLSQPQSGGMARRASDELAFFGETQRAFYADMVAYYRDELGCRQLINASNWKTADPIKFDDIERWTYTAADVIAVNRYYGGGAHTGPNSGWRIDPGDHFSQQSALLNPRELPTNLRQVVGHPMIVTESSWVSPLGFQSEGPFLVAAYQSLTGVDAFYWFSASEPGYATNPYFPYQKVNGQQPLLKWTASLPTIMGGFPAAALMFRRGDIAQGAPAVHEERPVSALWEREPPLLAEDRSFDPNRDRGHVAGTNELRTGLDPLTFLVGPVEVKYGGDPSKTKVIDLSRYIDPAKKVVRSVTGEISLDYGRGICTLDTPRAQGACGFLDKAGVIRLKDAAIRSGNGYATVAIVSMDGRPLSQSGKVLVQVGTSARPTGWKTRDAEFPGEDNKPTRGFEILRTGTPPWRIVDTKVSLTLRNPSLSRATRLDPAGYPAERVAVTRAGEDLTVKLPLNTMYLILEATAG